MTSDQDEVRAQIVADYARMAADLEQLVDNPGPAIHGENIARDPNGKPLPDEDIRGQARHLLADTRHDWADMLGGVTLN